MKTIFTFIVILSMSFALVAAEPPYSYNQLKYELQNLHFVNDSTGWIFNAEEYNAELLKTTDGGNNWFVQIKFEDYMIYSILSGKFFDENNGFFIFNTGYSEYVMYSTEDGGDTWSEITLPSTKKINSIHFFNEDIFWLSQAGLYKTIDRGKTWHLTHDNSYEFNALQFFGLMDGWALDKFSLITTTDAGLTWNKTKHTFWKIQLIDGNIGYGAKEDSLFKTDDFGATWKFVNKFNFAYTFRFVSKNVGFKIADSGVEKTVDGGKTWKLFLNEKFNYENNYEVAMLPNQEFIILSNRMSLNRTNDNGKTWDIKHFGAHSGIWDIKGIDDKRLIICGEDGIIGRTTNGGDMWEFRYDITHHNLRKIQIINNTVYIQGDSATFLKSTDFGENWQKIKLPDAYVYRGDWSYYPISDGFHFRDEKNGWIVGKGGIAFKTTNGGESFEVIKFDVEELYDVLFTDENMGYMLGSNEDDHYFYERVFLTTTNGGKDWQYNKGGGARFEYFDKDYLLISGGRGIYKYDIRNKTFESIYSDYRSIEGFFILDINTIWGWSMFEATCTFFKTTNGGEKWNFIENGCNTPTSLYFTDENNGWMVYSESGGIYKTNNGGYRPLKKPQLIYPPNNTVIPLDSLKLNYRVSYSSIEIQIAKDSLFVDILYNSGNLYHDHYIPKYMELYQKFFWRLRSYDSDMHNSHWINYSTWSDIWSFEVRWATKTKVKLISPLGIETKSLDLILSWNQLDYANKYRVQLSLDSTFQKISLDTITSVHGISKSKFLTINEKYFWRVKALNSTDSTIWSDIGYFNSLVLNSVDMNNFSDFSIHPNPATEYIEITVAINPTVNRRVDVGSEIKIFNTLGECVLTEPIHPMTPSHRMNVESLPRGVYYLRFGNRAQVFVKI
ncbi:MAG: YCF48-related protein [Candidatus Kapabacteria bacterium]|nr:YCF48-related protein [Candidatus Kapabacteria bacterium]